MDIACPESRQRRCGASTVEFAAVVPVFFILIFGIIEVGRGMMVTHLLNNAARDGCRAGIISGRGNTEIISKVSSKLSSQGINGETTIIQVNDAVADAETSATGDEITVIVEVPASNITWLPGAGYLAGRLSGQYSLRRE